MSAFKGCPCLMGQELHDFACMSLCLPCPSVCMCLCNVYDPVSKCGVIKHNNNYQGNICYTESGRKKKEEKEGRKRRGRGIESVTL